MKYIILYICLFFWIQYTQAQTHNNRKIIILPDHTWQYEDSVFEKKFPIIDLEIPAINTEDQLIKHSAYSLLYNIKHHQAVWVAYHLTSQMTIKSTERSNKFIPDPLLKNDIINDNDYLKSGYDRGHLAPAADMSYSTQTMQESFYYSNMSPQVPAFNRGIWKNLEEQVRVFANTNKHVYVVTGPVLSNGLQSIGNHHISVPEYYYKVILDYDTPSIKGIGFILKNEKSTQDLKSFAVSIDSIEKLTHIDFFNKLPDYQENIIESSICLECWEWNNQVTQKKNNTISNSSICKGVTKEGNACQNKTTNPNGYCYLHSETTPKAANKTNSTAVQCSGITKKGERCKRMTTNTNGRCYQH